MTRRGSVTLLLSKVCPLGPHLRLFLTPRGGGMQVGEGERSTSSAVSKLGKAGVGNTGEPVPACSLQETLPTGPGGERAKMEAMDQPHDHTHLHPTLHRRKDGFIPTFNSEILIEQLQRPSTALLSMTQMTWETGHVCLTSRSWRSSGPALGSKTGSLRSKPPEDAPQAFSLSKSSRLPSV